MLEKNGRAKVHSKHSNPSKASPFKVSPNKPIPQDMNEETFRPLNDLTENKNVGIWVQKILTKRLTPSQLKRLNTLIVDNDEILFAAFKLFENERDEEEFADTIIRIIQKSEETSVFPPRTEYTYNNQNGVSRSNEKAEPQREKLVSGNSDRKENEKKQLPVQREEVKIVEEIPKNEKKESYVKSGQNESGKKAKEIKNPVAEPVINKNPQTVEDVKMGLEDIFNVFFYSFFCILI